jgi:putative membrane protein
MTRRGIEETSMNRRSAVLGFSGGALAAFAPTVMRAAYAQTPANMLPRDLGQYRSITLMLGSLALQSSQLASQRATLAKVKQFAGFETAEQVAMAQVLTDAPAPKVAELDSTHAAQLQTLTKLPTGRDFDEQYVTLQLQGHRELLDVQNEFLQAQPSMSSDVVHIAMLARTTIQMHLVLLEELRQMMQA